MSAPPTDQRHASEESRPSPRPAISSIAVHDGSLRPRAHERLRWAGYRYTAGKRRVVEILAASPTPLTVEGIVAVDPQLPLSSVYRDLHHLSTAGVVTRLTLVHDRHHYQVGIEMSGRRQLHMVCVSCTGVTTIETPSSVARLVERAKREATTPLFTAAEDRLSLFGTCAECST